MHSRRNISSCYNSLHSLNCKHNKSYHLENIWKRFCILEILEKFYNCLVIWAYPLLSHHADRSTKQKIMSCLSIFLKTIYPLRPHLANSTDFIVDLRKGIVWRSKGGRDTIATEYVLEA